MCIVYKTYLTSQPVRLQLTVFYICINIKMFDLCEYFNRKIGGVGFRYVWYFQILYLKRGASQRVHLDINVLCQYQIYFHRFKMAELILHRFMHFQTYCFKKRKYIGKKVSCSIWCVACNLLRTLFESIIFRLELENSYTL